jgi:hypothetical protein
MEEFRAVVKINHKASRRKIANPKAECCVTFFFRQGAAVLGQVFRCGFALEPCESSSPLELGGPGCERDINHEAPAFLRPRYLLSVGSASFSGAAFLRR